MKFIRAFEASHAATTNLAPAEAQILHTLEQDWRTITAQPQSVSRFDPGLLDKALPYAFMLERTAPQSLRIRVAGQRLHDMLRMDPRGMPFNAFFTESARPTAMRLAETAFTGPAVVGIPLMAQRSLGRRPLRGEALLLPLRDAHGELTRVMGAIVVSGNTGSRGVRFDLADDQTVRCDVMDTPYPDRRARRGKVSAPTPAPARVEKPALRLVVDNG